MTSTFIIPVHISPTKPLTPSHIKYIIYLDLLYKINNFVDRDFRFNFNRIFLDISQQTLRFALFLRKNYSDIDFQNKNEMWLGDKYVEMYRRNWIPENQDITTLKLETEQNLKGFNFYEAILNNWISQYNFLGLEEPGYYETSPVCISNKEVIARLKRNSVITDHAQMGEGVYLDLIEYGQPIFKLTDLDVESSNILFNILRETFHFSPKPSRILFLFDQEMYSKYVAIQTVLEKLGYEIELISLSRVMLQDKIQSSRQGGWEGYTLRDIINRVEYRDLSEFRLGIKLYFLKVLRGNGSPNFNYTLLQRYIDKARYMNIKYAGIDKKPSLLREWLQAKLNRYKANYLKPEIVVENLFSSHTSDSIKKQLISTFLI